MSSNNSRILTDIDYITSNNIDENLKGDWAFFMVSSGKKFFVSSLYKINFEWNETKLKYSDQNTLKLNKEFATKIALINKGRYVKYVGIVNNKGFQITL